MKKGSGRIDVLVLLVSELKSRSNISLLKSLLQVTISFSIIQMSYTYIPRNAKLARA